MTFRAKLKNLVRFWRASPTKRTSGGGGGEGGVLKGGGAAAPPLPVVGVFFFDFNEIH